MLNLYNTLSKKLEPIGKKDHLNLYTCGPTVYNYAHIGNLRSYILADLLYRTLKYEGYGPRWVMNITDIDDKTIKGTIEKYGKDAGVAELKKFTDDFYQAFLKDLAEVNVLKDEITFIKVTDVIPQIQEFIVGLIDKDYAYKEDDGVYFNIEKYQKDFGDYGELVGQKFIEGKKVGARVKVDEYDKENLSDFALWKAHDAESDAQIFWDHATLGKGRPGWHIECSVINQVAFKGEPTDIHTGGVDLVFPHHTNEIAQSQALLGKGNFVKHWFHSEHLLVNEKRMAKSARNFHTLNDLKAKNPYIGNVLRFLFLQAKYNAQQNFTEESLKASQQAIVGIYTKLQRMDNQEIPKDEAALPPLENDLNVPQAIAEGSPQFVYSELLGVSHLPPKESEEPATELPQQVKEFLDQRDQAKQKKDFAKSDELRKQIEALGYEVMDTAEGQKIKKRI